MFVGSILYWYSGFVLLPTLISGFKFDVMQEEGWPLGLQPLNVRIGLGRGTDYFGSMSFNTTMLTGSPTSSTDSSSDLDTEVSFSKKKKKKLLIVVAECFDMTVFSH